MSAEFVSLAELLRAAAAESAASILLPSVRADGPCDDSGAAAVAFGTGASTTALDGGRADRDIGIAPHDSGDVTVLDSVDRTLLEPDGETTPGSGDALSGALRDARLFRARLADAFDDAVARLVRELAADVLARELRLAPVEIAALAQRVLARAPVIRIRVAPADVGFVRGVPVLADPSLAAGDAIVELGRGELDARLGVRLAAVLEAFA